MPIHSLSACTLSICSIITGSGARISSFFESESLRSSDVISFCVGGGALRSFDGDLDADIDRLDSTFSFLSVLSDLDFDRDFDLEFDLEERRGFGALLLLVLRRSFDLDRDRDRDGVGEWVVLNVERPPPRGLLDRRRRLLRPSSLCRCSSFRCLSSKTRIVASLNCAPSSAFAAYLKSS